MAYSSILGKINSQHFIMVSILNFRTIYFIYFVDLISKNTSQRPLASLVPHRVGGGM